jgi:hypothetical protein
MDELEQQSEAGELAHPIGLDQRHSAIRQSQARHAHVEMAFMLEEVEMAQPLDLGVVNRVLPRRLGMGKSAAGQKIDAGQPRALWICGRREEAPPTNPQASLGCFICCGAARQHCCGLLRADGRPAHGEGTTAVMTNELFAAALGITAVVRPSHRLRCRSACNCPTRNSKEAKTICKTFKIVVDRMGNFGDLE